MKYKVCLILTMALVCSTMAYADIRNSRRSFDGGVQSAQNMGRRSTVSNWTSKSSASSNFGSAWNYKGTELNGISHGSGNGQDPWQGRNNTRQRQSNGNWMTESTIDYTMSNIEVNYNFDYDYSFGDAAAEGQAYDVVSSQPWNEVSNTGWGGGYGSSQVQEYRYAQESNGNTIIEDMIDFVEMRIPSFGEESLAESLDMGEEISARMFGAGRNSETGGAQGQGANPGEGGAPLGDGMIPLALLAFLLAVTKWKKN